MDRSFGTALVLFFVTVSVVHADIPTTTVCGGTGYMAPWITRSVIAVFIGFAVYVVLYLVSKLFSMPKMEVWTKYELVQVAATFLLVMVLASIVEFMCKGSLSFFFTYPGYTPPSNMINTSYQYLTETLGWEMVGFAGVSMFSAAYNMLANTQINLGVGVPFIGGISVKELSPLEGLNTLDFAVSAAQSSLIAGMATTLAQYALLTYTFNIILGVVLPVGVLLRCFMPTRKFGGAMIGLSLGLGFLYPLLLSLNHMMVASVVPTGTSFPEYMKSLIKTTFEVLSTSVSIVSTGVTLDVLNILQDPFYAMFQFFRSGGTNPLAPDMGSMVVDDAVVESVSFIVSSVWLLLMKTVMIVVLVTAVLPLLDFIIVAAGTREFSRLLGAEVDIRNLTRML